MPDMNDAYADLKDLVQELGRVQERDVLRVEGEGGLPALELTRLVEYADRCHVPLESSVGTRIHRLLALALPLVEDVDMRARADLLFGVTMRSGLPDDRRDAVREKFGERAGTSRKAIQRRDAKARRSLAEAIVQLAILRSRDPEGRASGPELVESEEFGQTPYARRSSYHRRLQDYVADGQQIIELTGDSGNGKSRLAQEFLKEMFPLSQHRFEVHASSPTALLASMVRELARFGVREIGSSEVELRQALSALLNSESSPRVVLLDDVAEWQLVKDIVASSTVRCLITSTPKVVPRQVPHVTIEVDTLHRDQTDSIFRHYLPDIEAAALDLLTETLAGKPLAIEQACLRLQEEDAPSVSEYVRLLTIDAGLALNSDDDGERALATIYAQTLARLEGKSPDAVQLIHLISQTAGYDVPVLPVTFALALRVEIPDVDVAQARANAAIRVLRSNRLIKTTARGIDIHRLTSRIIRSAGRDNAMKDCVALHDTFAILFNPNVRHGTLSGIATTALPHVVEILMSLFAGWDVKTDGRPGWINGVEIRHAITGLSQAGDRERAIRLVYANMTWARIQPLNRGEANHALYGALGAGFRLGVTRPADYAATLEDMDALEEPSRSSGGEKFGKRDMTMHLEMIRAFIGAGNFSEAVTGIKLYIKLIGHPNATSMPRTMGDALSAAGEICQATNSWGRAKSLFDLSGKSYALLWNSDKRSAVRGILASQLNQADLAVNDGKLSDAYRFLDELRSLVANEPMLLADKTLMARFHHIAARIILKNDVLVGEVSTHPETGQEMIVGHSDSAIGLAFMTAHDRMIPSVNLTAMIYLGWMAMGKVELIEEYSEMMDSIEAKAKKYDDSALLHRSRLLAIKLRLIAARQTRADLAEAHAIGTACTEDRRYFLAIEAYLVHLSIAVVMGEKKLAQNSMSTIVKLEEARGSVLSLEPTAQGLLDQSMPLTTLLVVNV
ncbi:ATP-binding protein [Kribbella sp. NBC_01245]|uniref:ATP-binding protein n=1 Tax=Kribbella sp. NBC_01245 TaxID=2903578 RepID=UPI002E2D4D2D|nr:ATP-binding protein [Kribbella sp. NBC_01245]